MIRRRFIPSEAREKNPDTLIPDEEMKIDECDNSTVDDNVESKNDSSSALEIPFSPETPDSSRRALSVPESSMSSMLFEPSAGQCEDSSSSGLSHPTRGLCNKLILKPLRALCFLGYHESIFYDLVRKCDVEINRGEIICLRDLERTLINGASVSTRQEILI